MKALLIDENRNFVRTEVDAPRRAAGSVVIRIHAAGLNRADLLQRAGKYPPPPGWPPWPGLECAGTILESDAQSRWKPGDRVCALLGGGGYAEQVAVPEAMVLPLPRNLSMAEGASLPEAFATSYLNLCMEGELQSGETVLIHAGASGLGMAAIQLAKALGARIVTTVGSDAKAEAVRKLGADFIVNRKTESLAAVMERIPVNLALDCAGGTELGACMAKMAPGGRWILIATLAGESSEIPLRPLLKLGLRLTGSTLRSRTDEKKGQILRELEARVWPLIEAGAIRPSIYKVLSFSEVAQAHAILERKENIGKVILTSDEVSAT